MNIAFTYKRIALLTLFVTVACVAFVAAPKAHAQVSDAELAVLQAQVDEAGDAVSQLVSHTGKVLGVSTSWEKQWEDILQKLNANGLGAMWNSSNSQGQAVERHESRPDTKEGLKKQITKYNTEIERLTKLRDAAEKKLDKLSSSTASSSKKTFTITDVKSVKSEYVDPNPQMADEEYTRYTITLKNGKTVKVKQCGFCAPGGRDEAFKKAGYRGDVDDLRDMAKEGGTMSNARSPKFIKVTQDTGSKVVKATVYARMNVSSEPGAPAVDGPVTLGTIDWGDNSTKSNVSALLGTKSVSVMHTYTAAGTYTLTLKDDYGTKTKKFTVQ